MTKMKASSEAEASTKAKAASQAKAKASEVIDLEYQLVMTADGSTKKVSEAIDLPPTATFPISVKINKGMGEVKTPAPRKLVTDEQFRLQINGGRFCTAKKLHDHIFKLGKYGIIRCNFCPQVIDLPKNMRQHTKESVFHNLKYQAKINGEVKLHQQSIQMIDKETNYSETHDEVKEYSFKELIYAANV